PVAAARFGREVWAAGRLDHPNLVRATDAGSGGGVAYIAMELVDGLDLGRVAARLGPLPVADACELARQAADALAHVHERGLVHRDVKPSNLMIDAAGRVRLLDLGLAQAASAPDGALTASGQTVGTPEYMAPEQHADARRADARADLYG